MLLSISEVNPAASPICWPQEYSLFVRHRAKVADREDTHVDLSATSRNPFIVDREWHPSEINDRRFSKFACTILQLPRL